MNKHQDESHAGNDIYKVTKGCEYCEYRATSKGHLTKHEMAVHEVKKHQEEAHAGNEHLKCDERYPCKQCEYRATSKGSLTKHEMAVHEVNVKTNHMQAMISIK